MLEPNSRRLLLESLQPPDGYRLDWAVGTTYTLDLMALLTAPVAFAFSDWQETDGKPTANPLALLKAVRQFASRLCLFCQAGKIHVPNAYQPLLASLEDSIVQTIAPLGGSFHPKVWFLRFVAEDGSVVYRLLCMSRNLTFDRSWDTLLSLEGRLRDRANAFTKNHPLGEFVESLPGMSTRGLATTWRQRMKQLAHEIRRVEFEIPEPFTDMNFWPLGLGLSKHWPFPEHIDRLLVISPFIDDGLVADLAEWKAPMQLVSRPECLARLQATTLGKFEHLWILDDAADPEPGDIESENEDDSEAESANVAEGADIPLIGLHAKVYVADVGWNAILLTGSANATRAGFNRNVEFLVQLIGKKSTCGVAAMLGQPNGDSKVRASCLADMLQPYVSSGGEPKIDLEVEAFERTVDGIARDFATASLVLDCNETAEAGSFSVVLRPTKTVNGTIAQGCQIRARPASFASGQLHAVNTSDPIWLELASVSLLGLTSFIVFEVVSPDQSMKLQFVLNIPLINAPENRHEAVLRDLLSDSQNVMRFLLLMLLDSGARDLSRIFETKNGSQQEAGVLHSLFDSTLFESLMRALDREPERLDQVAQIIADLEKTGEGQTMLPEGLHAIWDPIWLVRQKQIERQNRKTIKGGGK